MGPFRIIIIMIGGIGNVKWLEGYARITELLLILLMAAYFFFMARKTTLVDTSSRIS